MARKVSGNVSMSIRVPAALREFLDQVRWEEHAESAGDLTARVVTQWAKDVHGFVVEPVQEMLPDYDDTSDAPEVKAASKK